MAKKTSSAGDMQYLWEGSTSDMFEMEDNIDDADVGEYNKEKMAIYAANSACARSLPDVIDSLKPIERRILYTMFNLGAYQKTSDPDSGHTKSSIIVGSTMQLHPHGDSPIYSTLVGMAQNFKRAQPLVTGIGNFGNEATPESYAHYRYTEAKLSKYAMECYFESYDPECVEMKDAAAFKTEEPVYLPSKFPNILINGSTSIGYGYNVVIPPYNIADVIRVTKQLIKNPEFANINIVPDIPNGCDIVENGQFEQICNTGRGVLRLRGRIDIEEGKAGTWILRIRSLPWQTSLTNVKQAIAKLAKDGQISIKDLHDRSSAARDKKTGEYRMIVNCELIIDKARDPNSIRNILFKKAGLEKHMGVSFRVVQDGLYVKLCSMKELLLTWIDSRREYLRRLYNKKYARLSARRDILRILIELTEGKNLEKTVQIIRKTPKAQLVDALVKEYGGPGKRMNSHQATNIASMSLSAFTADAHDNYVKELTDVQSKMDTLLKLMTSEDAIDEIIMDDLDDLKKYGTQRRSRIVTVSDNAEAEIPDTNHVLMVTKKGWVKKLPQTAPGETKTYGTFSAGDYPIARAAVNNRQDIIMFDSTGRYSILPVYKFENNTPKDPGSKIFEVTKLSGEVVSFFPVLTEQDLETLKRETGNDVFILTVTKNGLIKKTKYEEFMSDKIVRGSKGVKLKANDALISAFPLMSSTNVMIYSKNGNYTYFDNADIPELGKDTMGVMSINLESDDVITGFCVVPDNTEYIVVLTDKGGMKKIPMDGIPLFKNRRTSSYLAYTQNGEEVIICCAVTSKDKVIVCNKNQAYVYELDQIPEGSRRSRCKKVVPVALGDNIITMTTI